MLPLFLIGFYAFFERSTLFDWQKGRYFSVVASAGALYLLFAVIFMIPRYSPWLVDFPEVFWLVYPYKKLSYVVVSCAAAVLLYFAFAKVPKPSAYSAFFIATALLGNIIAFQTQIQFSRADKFIQAAQVTRNLLSSSEHDLGLVVGPDIGVVSKFLFGFDGNPFVKIFALGKVMSAHDIPDEAKWVILLDEYDFDVPFLSTIQGQGFYLGRIKGDMPFEVTKPRDDLPIELRFTSGNFSHRLLMGFHQPESWGTWSKTEEPSVVLPEYVDGQILMTMSAMAFGPNAGRAITVKMGEAERRLRFNRSLTTLEVSFNLSKPVRQIRFSGLRPTSPTALGESLDSRPLGIGLASLSICRVGKAGNCDAEKSGDRKRAASSHP